MLNNILSNIFLKTIFEKKLSERGGIKYKPKVLSKINKKLKSLINEINEKYLFELNKKYNINNLFNSNKNSKNNFCQKIYYNLILNRCIQYHKEKE
jgi:hypothetical protein